MEQNNIFFEIIDSKLQAALQEALQKDSKFKTFTELNYIGSSEDDACDIVYRYQIATRPEAILNIRVLEDLIVEGAYYLGFDFDFEYGKDSNLSEKLQDVWQGTELFGYGTTFFTFDVLIQHVFEQMYVYELFLEVSELITEQKLHVTEFLWTQDESPYGHFTIKKSEDAAFEQSYYLGIGYNMIDESVVVHSHCYIDGSRKVIYSRKDEFVNKMELANEAVITLSKTINNK